MLAGNYDARNAGLLAECGPTDMKQKAAICSPRKGMGWLGRAGRDLGQIFERGQDWDKLQLIHPLRPIP